MGKKVNYFLFFLIGAAIASVFILYPPARESLIAGTTMAAVFVYDFVMFAPAQFFSGAVLAGILVFMVAKGYLKWIFGGVKELRKQTGGAVVAAGLPLQSALATQQPQVVVVEKKE